MMTDRNDSIQQQAIQAAEADFAVYQQAYRSRWNELLANQQLFELQKQVIARKSRCQGLELAMLAATAQQEGFYEGLKAIESGDLSRLQIKKPQPPNSVDA